MCQLAMNSLYSSNQKRQREREREREKKNLLNMGDAGRT